MFDKILVLSILMLLLLSFYGCATTAESKPKEVQRYVSERFGFDSIVKPIKLKDMTTSGALVGRYDWEYEIQSKENPNFKFFTVGNPYESSNSEMRVIHEYLVEYYEPKLRVLLNEPVNKALGNNLQLIIEMEYSGMNKDKPSNLKYNEMKPIEDYIRNEEELPFLVNINVLKYLDENQYSENLQYEIADKLAKNLKSIGTKEEIIDNITFRVDYISSEVQAKLNKDAIHYDDKYQMFVLPTGIKENIYKSDCISMKVNYLRKLYSQDIFEFFKLLFNSDENENTKFSCYVQDIFVEKFENLKYTDKETIEYYIARGKDVPFSLVIYVNRKVEKQKFDPKVEAELFMRLINKIKGIGNKNNLLESVAFEFKYYQDEINDKIYTEGKYSYKTKSFSWGFISEKEITVPFLERLFQSEKREFDKTAFE